MRTSPELLTECIDSTHAQSMYCIKQIRMRAARWHRMIQAFQLSPVPKDFR